EADVLHASALDGARDAGDARLEGLVHLRRAHASRMRGEAAATREAIAEALAVAARTGDPVIGSLAERLAAGACQQALDVEGGLAAIGRAVRHARRSEDPRLIARAVLSQAVLLADAGDPVAALEQALATRGAMQDDAVSFGFACLVAGVSALALGRRREADRLLDEAVASNRGAGLPRLAAYALAFVGVSAFEQGQLQRSDDAFASAEHLFGPAAEPVRVAAARGGRAVIAAIGGQTEKARRTLAKLREDAAESDRPLVELFAAALDAVGSSKGENDPAHARIRARVDAVEASQKSGRDQVPSVVWRLSLRLVRGVCDAYAPPAGAVVLDRAEQQLRLPSGDLVPLARKPMLWRLVQALAEAHLGAPGERVESGVLVALVWPDEKMSDEAAQNRLAVALHKLRKLGLENVIEARANGASFRAGPVVVWSARPLARSNKAE
ncbi:MAG: Signal transduction response regulator, partial [Labilithrix sp.]|nr:Signal transduction response regulator [Labilithrix sp.]